MKQYAKHRVTVWLEDEFEPDPQDKNSSKFTMLIPTGAKYPEWKIEHPEECDKLKYGKLCCLDWMLEHDGEGMPEESGIYEVWAVDDSSFVNNWSHYGWEPEYYIEFNKISDLPEGVV